MKYMPKLIDFDNKKGFFDKEIEKIRT